ncbi:carbon-nitrogen hydrolase family protein [Kribbella sp. NPDC004536]|uniref:carbon-nitrogen hydrolase family protein n=1 Tax=Kribbella sp. NPDC004536 TaxID=3364106 RepID=UPI0036751841
MSSGFTVAAVQAAYVLLDRDATVARVEQLVTDAAMTGAELVVLPEAFVPGTPLWIDSGPIWAGDGPWYAKLVEQAVVVPGPVTAALGAIARANRVHLVIGVQEREPYGTTIYNTVLYFGADGRLLNKHRKLVPTGSERTVWGQGDGSTLDVVPTPLGRLGGLTCWENYMPLARFHQYAQGVEVWLAPTLARGDGWVATMQHIAREGRMWVVGVNPCLRYDQIPADLPDRSRIAPEPAPGDGEWIEPGNTLICDPSGQLVAGPLRHAEGILTTRIDLTKVAELRRLFDVSGHYHRPDIFSLTVDTRPRPAITTVTAPQPSETDDGQNSDRGGASSAHRHIG